MAAEPTPVARRPGFVARANVGTTVLVVALLVLASMLIRVWLGRRLVTPWYMTDEIRYADLARSIAEHGRFLIHGEPYNLHTLYVVLIAPAWFAHPMSTTYGLVKAINAVAMTSAVVPLYLWATRLVPRRHAVLASGLFLLLPTFIYTGLLVTENAFLPAFLLAAFAISLALERPTLWRQIVALAAILLASAVRFQGLVLLIVLPLAIVFKIALDVIPVRGGDRLRFAMSEVRRFWPTAALFVVGAAAYVVLKVARSESLSSVLGKQAGVTHSGYSAHEVFRWLLYHVAELPLAVAVIPISAFIVLAGLAVTRSRETPPAEKAFVAVTLSCLVCVLIEVAAYASRFSGRIEERYMVALTPLLLVAFVVWLAKGLPRPLVLTAVATTLPVALLATLPLGRLLNLSILSDTFGLIPVYRLSLRLDSVGGARTALLLGAAAAGLLFALIPRRVGAAVLTTAMAAFLVISSYSIDRAIREYATGLSHAGGLSGDPSWVDNAIGRDAKVTYLFGNGRDQVEESMVLWQTEFWNRSLRGVANRGLTEAADFPEQALNLNGETGRLAGARVPQYVVTWDTAALAGRVVARHPPLALYRVRPPLRITSSVDGVYGDGWMGADASYSRYSTGGRPGVVRVTVSRTAWGGPNVLGRVRIVSAPLRAAGVSAPAPAKPFATAAAAIDSRAARVLTVRVPARAFRVQVSIHPTFSPQHFGFPDARQLGAQVSFRYSSVSGA